MRLRQLSVSRRSLTIAIALVGMVSLALGAHATLNKRSLDGLPPRSRTNVIPLRRVSTEERAAGKPAVPVVDLRFAAGDRMWKGLLARSSLFGLEVITGILPIWRIAKTIAIFMRPSRVVACSENVLSGTGEEP